MTDVRFRCRVCGNLTRFDLFSTRRTRRYQHFTLGGELKVDEETVLQEEVEAVECRWCGPSGDVETIDARDIPADDDGSAPAP